MPYRNHHRKLRIHYLALAVALVLALALPLSVAAQNFNGVSVSVGSADLEVGETDAIPVEVKNFPGPHGMGAYVLEVSFTPGVIEVLDVLGGDAPFDTVTAHNIDNDAGWVWFTSLHAAMPGPTGDFIIAHLMVRATGAPGTDLTLTIHELVDFEGDPVVAATPEDGEVTVSDMPPVGGTAHPVNRVTLLAPWIAVAAIMAGMSLMMHRRGRAQSQA